MALRLLDGIVDIYMPDAKFDDPAVARSLCGVAHYPRVNRACLREMHRQVGDLLLDVDGVAVRGLIVRHLVLPGSLAGIREVLRFVAEHLSRSTYLNLMDRYRPCHEATRIRGRPAGSQRRASRGAAVRAVAGPPSSGRLAWRHQTDIPDPRASWIGAGCLAALCWLEQPAIEDALVVRYAACGVECVHHDVARSGSGDTEPLSQRFIRCRHCGLPHNLSDELCPITGKPIRRRRQGTAPDRPSEASAGAHHDDRAEPIPLVQHRSKSSDARPAVQAERSTPQHPLLDHVIGDKYRVRAVIGEGGMGTVYEAEHLTIGRKVAIKVLNRAHLGRREAVARFHQEARAAGAIGHPNICEIYDVGALGDGSPYLVMERLYGKTLADRINLEGALPFEDVIAALTQVLSALVAAHEKNIIHRDIKPENIFLSERVGCAPVVKILDFGISKFEGEDPELSLTRTGMVMGTPFYMAPEQARGEVIDHRVDVYACGVILYEALTGRRPFIASNYNALVVQILATQPKDPREVRPAIPAGFVPLIFKALAKKREDRFRDANEFLRELLLLQEELARSPTPKEIARMVEAAKQSVPPPPLPSSPPLSSDSVDIPVVFSETGTGNHPVIDPSTAEILAAQAQAEAEDEPTVVDDSEEIQAVLASHRRPSRVRMPTDPGADDVHDTIVDPSGEMLRELWAQLPPGQNPQARMHNHDAAVDATQRTSQLDGQGADEALRRVEAGRSERPPAAGRCVVVADGDEPTEADAPPTERLQPNKPRRSTEAAPRKDPRGLAAYMAMAEGQPARRRPSASGVGKGAGKQPKERTPVPGRDPAPRPSGIAVARVQPVPRPDRPPVVQRPEHPRRHVEQAPRAVPPPTSAAASDGVDPDDDAVTTLFVSSEGGRNGSSQGAETKTTDRSSARSSDSSPTIPRTPRPPGTPRL